MRTVNFPNGLTLTSTALSAEDVQDAFQLAVLQMLGINSGTVTQGTLNAGSNLLAVTDIGTAAVGQMIGGRGIPLGTVITDIGTVGGFGSGGFGDNPFNSPGSLAITMSANADYGNLYGAGGYGDQNYGTPTTWTTTVFIGSDANAFSTVRVGWQKDGQPGWGPGQDVVTVMAVVVDDRYNRIRDVSQKLLNDTTNTQTTDYTRAWEIRFSVYGPNSTDNARLIKSCLRLDWVRAIFSAVNLYLVPDERDPVRFPENFNKQWWDRSDFRAKYYEAVQETITQQTVASAEVILETAIGGYGDGTGDDPYGDLTTVNIDFTVSV